MNLDRFVAAQASIFDQALAEIHAGRKQTHWMWFIFPQIRGLGLSEIAKFYAICGQAEAQAYLSHPLLGPRLAQCTGAALDQPAGTELRQLFGTPDDLKFRSSMTLFARAAPVEPNPFREALARFCAGQEDLRTLALLGL